MHTHSFSLVFHRFVWPSVTGKRCVFISQADKQTPLISLMRGMRIRYRGTHATQKWDISFAAHRSAESRRLKRWQTLSLYAALIYATVYEMNVLNPWWWRPRGQLINRVHARVYIEHKTETMSIVYVQQLLITVTINTQVYGDVGFDIIRTSTSGFSLVLKVLLMDESSVCVHRAECLSVCVCVSI